MHVNDAKHAFLLSALVLTEGHIKDLEHAWLKTLVLLPLGETIDDLWKAYMVQLGFPNEFEWLGSLGHTGTITDRWYSFWSGP